MRVELIYSPGCSTYKKALELLETVIAEERLPIPVELSEQASGCAPVIRVDGEEVDQRPEGLGLEDLRNSISQRWRHLTGGLLASV